MNRIFLIFAAFIFTSAANAQSLPEDTVKQMIESKNFNFLARVMSPLGGRARQLTSDYTIRVQNDSLVVDLPYFGRVYSATYGANNGGFDFTSVKFDYNLEKSKRGGYTLIIKPKDISDPRIITLDVGSMGSTSVTVISNNRQSISYTGVLRKNER